MDLQQGLMYGTVCDAGLDVLWAMGIGPVIAWVDDHLFICLLQNAIANYNKLCQTKAQAIASQDSRIQDDGHWKFKGDALADGSHEDFSKDCTHSVRNFISNHLGDSWTTHAYDFEHINCITDQLGIPWEPSKDTPFSSSPVFIGFMWDIENKTVALTLAKHTKYIAAIHEWLRTTAHTLEQAQKLHGRLSYASLVIPVGSAYLTSLQSMLGIFGNNPFMPRRQPHGTVDKLNWWLHALSSKPPIPIPHHPLTLDLQAFSNASSSHGLVIVIGSKWRAWRLHQHWNHTGRDIRWAEGVTFELLVHTLLTLDHSSMPLTVYCDNQGVIDGWKNGRSRNTPTNTAFRQVHALLASPPCRVFMKYVPSADNPADGPSQGKYPPAVLLLLQILIPEEISDHILDLNDPNCTPILL